MPVSAPALVIGLIVVAGVSGVVGFAYGGLKTATQTTTTTSNVTTVITVATPTTVVGTVDPQQHLIYYIALAGVTGEFSVLNYTGLIQLKAWDWGAPRTTCNPSPAGGPPCTTGGQSTLDFNATTNKASVTLQQDASQGTPIATGTLIGVAFISGQTTVAVKYDFTNLLVASYSTNNSANLPVDVVTLVFQKVTVVV